MSVIVVTGTGSGVGSGHVTAALRVIIENSTVADPSVIFGRSLADAVRHLVDLEATHETVIVPGGGGLLVPLGKDDLWTLADLAATLRASAVVVTDASQDSVNHTALTVGRLAEDGITLAGVVIGRWPNDPDRATRARIVHLAALGPDGRLAGVLSEDFDGSLRAARASLTSKLGGRFNAVRFAQSMSGS